MNPGYKTDHPTGWRIECTLIRIGKFDITECWDGVFHKKLHDFQHHPGTQFKAVLEYQALRDGLILPYTIGVLLKQFFLLVRHGSFEFYFIPADQLLQLLVLLRGCIVFCRLDIAVPKFFQQFYTASSP